MQFERRKKGEPYMLIFAGTGRKNVELPDGTITSCHDVKRDLGYPQLLAWKNERKELDRWVEYLREHPDCPCKLVVDSSAYSAWTRGLQIDIDEYIAYINSISDVVYWFAELDKIPGEFGGEHTPEELAEAKATAEAYKTVFGKADEFQELKVKKDEKDCKVVKSVMISSPVNGTAADLSTTPDEAFAQRMMGDGAAVTPEDVTVYEKNGENYTLIKFADIMGVSGKNVHAYMSNSSLDKVRVIITE